MEEQKKRTAREIIENYEGITDIEIENGEIEILIQIPDK